MTMAGAWCGVSCGSDYGRSVVWCELRLRLRRESGVSRAATEAGVWRQPPGSEARRMEGVPSPEDLLRFLDQLKDLSPEDREQLRLQLLSQAGVSPPEPPPAPPSSQFFMLVSLLAIVTFLFVFFGYKLYKSLKEKERKREEKKKLKQQKKKK